MDGIRRVVTGIDETGRSVFVSDERVAAVAPPILNGAKLIELFGADEHPTIPTDGAVASGLKYFPELPHGWRFGIFSYPPETELVAPDDFEEALAETKRLVPGLENAVSEPGGEHYTPTIDLEYVIEGEFTLTLDHGASTVLKQGDCLVQCGAKHSWANKSSGQSTMLVIFIAAELDEDRFGAHRIRH
jgi:hypothetical protein